MPKTPMLPWWYQPDASGENSMDRRIESGRPIIPEQIEIRDGGIFWSFDPEHKLLRIDPGSSPSSQLLGGLRNAFALLSHRSDKQNRLGERDRLLVLRHMKYNSTRSSPGRRALTKFLELQQGSPEGLLAYAGQHGVLDICEHGYPHGHHPSCTPNGWPLEGWTSLDAWRKYAHRFAAVLRISTDLKEDPRSCGREDDWAVVFSNVLNEETRKLLRAPTTREEGLNLLQAVANDYLRIGEVNPILSRTSNGWKICFTGNSLYPLLGSLATQLAVIVCGAEAIYTCSGCGEMYQREGARRRPKRETANYCPRCGKSAAVLAAKRRYSAKRVEARNLRSQGLTIPEIARKLRSDGARVRRWVAE
jgi:hypothetical protein